MQEVEKQFFGSEKLADEPTINETANRNLGRMETGSIQSHTKHSGRLSTQEAQKEFDAQNHGVVSEFPISAIKGEPSTPQSMRSFADTGIRTSLTKGNEESRIVGGEHPLLGVENAGELPAPDEISEFVGNASSDLIQKCDELFGEYRMKCFFSKNWALREAALSKMTLLVPEVCSSTDGDCAEVVCKIVEIGICDINMQVYFAALVLLDESLLQFENMRLPQEKITPPLSRIIIILLDKLTDSKTKIVDSAELAILSMASSSCTDNASIIRAATRRVRSKESKDGRTVKARLTLLESFSAEFGTSVPLKRIVEFVLSSNAFEHKDGGVRDSARSLVVTLMAVHGGDSVFALLKNCVEVSERLVEELRVRFAMIKNS